MATSEQVRQWAEERGVRVYGVPPMRQTAEQREAVEQWIRMVADWQKWESDKMWTEFKSTPLQP